jgi:hypothetical protein
LAEPLRKKARVEHVGATTQPAFESQVVHLSTTKKESELFTDKISVTFDESFGALFFVYTHHAEKTGFD